MRAILAAMQRISHWVDDVLACDDGELDDDLFDRIVALGGSARAKLLELATDPAWRGAAADGGGLAPYHALELLAALPPDDATIVRLVESIAADPVAEEVDHLVTCLVDTGPEAVPHVLAALAATSDREAAAAFCEALALGEVRDDRVFAALVAAFAQFPGDVAPWLAEYGDPRIVRSLHLALDCQEVGAGSSPGTDSAAITLAEAIADLGGDLTEDERRKYDLANRRSIRRLARVETELSSRDEPAAGPPPRPNDPCPCGSGRKFKKCCEGEGEFGGTASSE